MNEDKPASHEAVVLHGLVSEYLYIIDELDKREVPLKTAMQIAGDLVSSFLTYSNNNKFAESTPVLLAPEEETHG